MAALSMMMVGMLCASAAALTIELINSDGTPLSVDPANFGFKWLIEEDNTYQTPPQVRTNASVGTVVHQSYAPLVTSGFVAGTTASLPISVLQNFVPVEAATDPAKAANFAGRFYLSVLPTAGYHISGAPINLTGLTDASVVKVKVNKLPLPTAQISVKVHEDNNPVNNVFDPGEKPYEGFKILLDDTAGNETLDVFGNEIGTTYETDPVTGEFLMADGAPVVKQIGLGYVPTDALGEAVIKNLAPGKYGVRVEMPTEWTGKLVQTSTIEGTHTIDAWVKADEPVVSMEGFGTGTWHTSFGFIDKTELAWVKNPALKNGTCTLRGKVNYNHFGAPPKLVPAPFDANGVPNAPLTGAPLPECMIALNDPLTATGLWFTECNADSSFEITGIPAGTYELAIWDKPLDSLFNLVTVNVYDSGTVVGAGTVGTNCTGPSPATAQCTESFDILSNAWFANFAGSVFYDANENGFRDAGEIGILEQVINLRYRNGAIYQSTVTDPTGGYEFAEVFPFFKWLVAEVDFARFKATGMTAVTDQGGYIPLASADPADPGYWAEGARTPQVQPAAGENPAGGVALTGLPYRTETGPVLTQATQQFLSAYNFIDWGKKNYAPGENGGISGLVVYATTRAVDDPRYEAQEIHEPGIPRVTVNLYLAEHDIATGTYHRKDLDGDGQITEFDIVNQTQSDSWDDANPEGCVWGDRVVPLIDGQAVNTCMDNFATWNQIRPGVFDGGYAFTEYFSGGNAPAQLVAGTPPDTVMGDGSYIVEVVVPQGYTLQKEEDKNVDFGPDYTPSLKKLPATCVGDPHLVPQHLSFNTYASVDPADWPAGVTADTPLPGVDAADLVASLYAGQTTALCDKKLVHLGTLENAAADFHLFTPVPKASRAVGFALNDLGAEFDKTSPIYGEKPSPKWIPISFRDWAGNELNRVYTDEYGSYNAMIPSSYTNNIPAPRGAGYQIVTAFLNHPWMDAGTQRVLDPNYDPSFSQMAWTFMYDPGTTSYLDSPILPVGGFVGYPDFTVDLEPPTGTPVVAKVTSESTGAEPAALAGDFGPLLRSESDVLIITSMGKNVRVPNPDYNNLPTTTTPKFITRDFDFGLTSGQVTVDGVPLTILSWTPDVIRAKASTGSITNNILRTGQLEVVRGDTKMTSPMAVTVHVTTEQPFYVTSQQSITGSQIFHSIQEAIDSPNVTDGSLIMVRPGVYAEAPIVYKNLRLQGYGGTSTQVYPYPDPVDKLAAWHAKAKALAAAGEIPEIAGLVALPTPQDSVVPGLAPIEMPGFMILDNATRAQAATTGQRLVDGFYITGAISGGGMQVPDNGRLLTISNNVVTGNQGTRGGGITVGNLPDAPANNPDIAISYNKIAKNSGQQDGGGGVTLISGATRYLVEHNLIAANMTGGNGGGLLHAGLNDDGVIRSNKFLFNEVFFGKNMVGHGGGMYIGGLNGLNNVAGAAGLADGAGDVTIDANLIQGNLAGSGSGGAIRVAGFNGAELELGAPYKLIITNNMIVNNVAALDGGAISLHDAINAAILFNTITNNQSTATAASAFPAGANISDPQGAGIVGWPLSAAVLPFAGGKTFSDPLLQNDIIWNNLSYNMDKSANNGEGALVQVGVSDLAVFGGAGAMTPVNCLLTTNDPAATPSFMKQYLNNLLFSVVIDEGGNNVSARFDPLYWYAGDYHYASASSPGVGQATTPDTVAYPTLTRDFDGQVRANAPDIGADEFGAAIAPAIIPTCAADIVADGVVNVADLTAMIQQNVDLNGDGAVDNVDYLVWLASTALKGCN